MELAFFSWWLFEHRLVRMLVSIEGIDGLTTRTI